MQDLKNLINLLDLYAGKRNMQDATERRKIINEVMYTYYGI